VTPLALTLDEGAALAVAALAALWLARRAARVLSKKRGGGCACPSAGTCGPKGPTRDELSAAAARAVATAAGRRAPPVNRGAPPLAR